ncbi:MAG: hypothetical protein CMI01_05335 [Oceanospirillaceae bacterium]|jgi:small-conductance mechanosensitive channel|uniref:hypothetical protein n=1 Tax=Marinobacterium litorale TaxID=404770 RepID=UPI00041BE674|nr:hypothetical protein [Marinobacterium litorale]MBS98081.1 hypothetical protein [Oceanospirillaceae bacterium]
MNINGISAQSAALYSSNRSADGVQRAASDVQGSGQPQEPEQATGRDPNVSVRETTVNASDPAATTQVVEEASEALGTVINTRA